MAEPSMNWWRSGKREAVPPHVAGGIPDQRRRRLRHRGCHTSAGVSVVRPAHQHIGRSGDRRHFHCCLDPAVISDASTIRTAIMAKDLTAGSDLPMTTRLDMDRIASLLEQARRIASTRVLRAVAVAGTLRAGSVSRASAAAGRLVRLACQRHIDDLASGKQRGLRWDPATARHAIDFFGHLHHSTGEWADQPFTLQLWQGFVIGSLFGWKRADGLRRFRTAYVEVARKNGKSVMPAGTALYGSSPMASRARMSMPPPRRAIRRRSCSAKPGAWSMPARCCARG